MSMSMRDRSDPNPRKHLFPLDTQHQDDQTASLSHLGCTGCRTCQARVLLDAHKYFWRVGPVMKLSGEIRG